MLTKRDFWTYWIVNIASPLISTEVIVWEHQFPFLGTGVGGSKEYIASQPGMILLWLIFSFLSLLLSESIVSAGDWEAWKKWTKSSPAEKTHTAPCYGSHSSSPQVHDIILPAEGALSSLTCSHVLPTGQPVMDTPDGLSSRVLTLPHSFCLLSLLLGLVATFWASLSSSVTASGWYHPSLWALTGPGQSRYLRMWWLRCCMKIRLLVHKSSFF